MNGRVNDRSTGQANDQTTGQPSGQQHTRLRSRGLWRLCGGLILWASCFATMYGAQAAGCGMGLEASTLLGVNGVTLGLLAIWGAHLGGLALRLARERRSEFRNADGPVDDQKMNEPSRRPRPSEDAAFFSGVGRILTVVALLATIWTGFAIVLLPPCL